MVKNLRAVVQTCKTVSAALTSCLSSELGREGGARKRREAKTYLDEVFRHHEVESTLSFFETDRSPTASFGAWSGPHATESDTVYA